MEFDRHPASDFARAARDYARVERAIRYLERNWEDQPDLGRVAASVHLSEYHFQRLFQRWAGISPKRFLQFLTKEHAKQRLRASATVLDAALSSGLSGTGRLHDLLVQCEAVTPGEYRRLGAGLEIRYGFHATPFGKCLLASTSRGICSVAFLDGNIERDGVKQLRKEWPQANLREDVAATGPLVERIFTDAKSNSPLPLLLKGTNFQIKVWEALLRVPAGSVTTYARLAQAAGEPRAARAVGSAVARNPIAYLIPCHRVLRSAGDIGGYRWGTARKLALLAREAAQTE